VKKRKPEKILFSAMTGCFLCPSDFVLAPSECLMGHLETCHKVQRGQELLGALFSVGDQGRQLVQFQLQALLGVKVEPKEAIKEVVKKEEGLENLRLGLAVEEEENERKWAVERERRMALDYYVNMAISDGGGVSKNCGRKRKRNSDTGEEGGGTESKERKSRKPRKPRAPRKPRDRLG